MLYVQRFAAALVAATGLLFAVYLLRGQDLQGAGLDALLWGTLSATVYTIAVWRKRRQCVLCRY